MIKEIKETQQEEKVVEYKREKHTYNGMDYLLILNGLKGEEYKDKDDINDNLWWVIEYPKKDEKLALCVLQGFLYYDSRFMAGYRIKDKYHHCELTAMAMINRALDDNVIRRIKWFWREVTAFIYAEWKLWYKQIWHKVRKRLSKDKEMERAMAKQIKK